MTKQIAPISYAEKGTWAISAIPSNWEWRDFSCVFQNVTNNARKLQQKHYANAGKYPVIDQGVDFIGGYTNNHNLLLDREPPYVVFGDHTRCIKYVDFPFVQGADGVKVLSPIDVNPKFAFYLLKAIRLPDKGYSRHYKFLRASQFPIPPADQQQRIVEHLEEQFSKLDAGVTALKRAQANLKRYRASVLKAAVEGRLTEEWRKAHPNIEPASELLKRILVERRRRWEENQKAKAAVRNGGTLPKNFSLPAYKEPKGPSPEFLAQAPLLPKGWCWATVEQASEPQSYALAIGPFGSSLKVDDYRKFGVPLIFVRNIRAKSFPGDTPRFIDFDKASSLNAHLANPGDILVTKMGDPPGDATLYPDDQPAAVITADCIKITPFAQHYNALFLTAMINSKLGRDQIQKISKGVAQQKVSLDRFRSLAVPSPPLEEQVAIVQYIEQQHITTEKSETAIFNNLVQSQNLRKSILGCAFSQSRVIY